MFGYMGKVLRVDLTARRTWDEPLAEDLLRLYLGGRAVPVSHRGGEREGPRVPPDLLGTVPQAVRERFAGVGNPFVLGPIQPGENILDVGCGAGLDALVAA